MKRATTERSGGFLRRGADPRLQYNGLARNCLGYVATLVFFASCAPVPAVPATASATMPSPTAACAACRPQGPGAPTSTLCEATPPESYMLAQPTPQRVIAGGPAQSGPFTFTLFLYRDDRLDPVTWAAPWCHSDIAGVGVYMDWVYHGPPISGPVEVSWGPDSELMYMGTLQCVGDGFHDGRAGGGILLPANASPGDTVSWVMMAHTPQGCYGAALRFLLIEGAEGFEQRNVSVQALPAEQLRTLCQ